MKKILILSLLYILGCSSVPYWHAKSKELLDNAKRVKITFIDPQHKYEDNYMYQYHLIPIIDKIFYKYGWEITSENEDLLINIYISRKIKYSYTLSDNRQMKAIADYLVLCINTAKNNRIIYRDKIRFNQCEYDCNKSSDDCKCSGKADYINKLYLVTTKTTRNLIEKKLNELFTKMEQNVRQVDSDAVRAIESPLGENPCSTEHK